MQGQKLLLSQKQSLKINPQQIQFLNFLQLNEIEIEDLIQKELEENPLLDEKAPNEPEAHQFIEHSFHQSIDNMPVKELSKIELAGPIAEIKEQLQFSDLSKKQLQLAFFLLDSINEKGFLEISDDALEDIVSFAGEGFFTSHEICEIRAYIQHLEPIGLTSRNLREYLLLQARADKLPHAILQHCFEEMAERDFGGIAEKLGVSMEQTRNAITAIAAYQPYPLHGFSLGYEPPIQIIPEFKVELREGLPVGGILTGNIRKLQFNEAYLEVLQFNRDNRTRQFLQKKANDAQWFMQAIAERQKTMSACIAAIVKLQREYFISGNTTDLKPMILKDVADLTGRTVSTISRVTSQKFVETHFGILSMKSLFSEAIQKNNGEFISNKEVQEFVYQLVTSENKGEPLTDSQIQLKLKESGVSLTRRTITKYRENMNIPPSKYRKSL